MQARRYALLACLVAVVAIVATVVADGSVRDGRLRLSELPAVGDDGEAHRPLGLAEPSSADEAAPPIGRWVDLPDLPVPLRDPRLVAGEQRLVALGRPADEQHPPDHDVLLELDQTAGSWQPLPEPPGRVRDLAVAGDDLWVLTASDDGEAPLLSRLTPARTWQSPRSLPAEIVGWDEPLVASGAHLLVVEHRREVPGPDAAIALHRAPDGWWRTHEVPVSPAVTRGQAVVASAGDGRVALIGGAGGDTAAPRQVTVFDPAHGWSPVSPAPVPGRWRPQAVPDPHGEGLVLHGRAFAGPGQPRWATVRWTPEAGLQEIGWPAPPRHLRGGVMPMAVDNAGRVVLWAAHERVRPFVLEAGAQRWRPTPMPFPHDEGPRASAWADDALVVLLADRARRLELP